MAGGYGVRRRNDSRKPAPRVPGRPAGGSAAWRCWPVFAVLFRDYRTDHFVSQGVACLTAGLLHAIPAALAGWLLLRRGFAVNPVAAGVVAGHARGTGWRDHAGASLRESPGPACDALAYRGDTGKRGRGSVAGLGGPVLRPVDRTKCCYDFEKRMRGLPGKGNRSGTQGRRQQLVVLYEDDAVVAIDKPAGLSAVPVKGSDAKSAWSLLSAQLGARRQRAFVVHRIDRFTSGVLLFAKTEADRDALVRQFLRHTPERQYLAIIRGHLAAREGTLIHYFRREGMHQKLTAESDRNAARAELRYLVERPLRAASLVRVTLVTGLQNQIRVQFSASGHPVIGDRKYHPAEASERRIARVALHAAHLQFHHPRSGNSISVDSEPPADFRSLLQSLLPPPRARG